ncbi:MAG: hypothetical protein Q4F84_11145 [Fibrobacter sp.]|nr:hypothetical protein [Fibrobacter sp.]
MPKQISSLGKATQKNVQPFRDSKVKNASFYASFHFFVYGIIIMEIR